MIHFSMLDSQHIEQNSSVKSLLKKASFGIQMPLMSPMGLAGLQLQPFRQPMQPMQPHTIRVQGPRVPVFKSLVFGGDEHWDHWIEEWAPKIYTFVKGALGSFGREPLGVIHPLDDGLHAAGATASFDLGTGLIQLDRSVENQPGVTLEKLTHEMLHGSYAEFPQNDPYYDEGYVDYSTWVLAHAPVWGRYRDDMIRAAEVNISNRENRALQTQTDYDAKRWAGGVFASMAFGPNIIARLRAKKEQRDFKTW